jgi:hypothetical protein
MELLKTISMICDKEIIESHRLRDEENVFDTNMFEFLKTNAPLEEQQLRFQGADNFAGQADILTKEGVCRSYNIIDEKVIFRNDTVDPQFLKQYKNQGNDYRNLYPQFWSLEGGYVPNRIDNYPYRSFDKGKDSGFSITLSIPENFSRFYDTSCRSNSLSYKIAVHHPMEVANGDFFLVPFNKSVSFYVKPKITKTAESLESYDSGV